MIDANSIRQKRIELLKMIRNNCKKKPVRDVPSLSNVKNWLSGRSCPSWEQFIDYCKHYEINLSQGLTYSGYGKDNLSYESFVLFLLKDFSRQNLQELLDLSPSSISKILSLQVRLNLDKIMLLMTISTRPFSMVFSKVLGTRFVLRESNADLEEKYRLVERLLIEKPWINTLIEGSYMFCHENESQVAEHFADYFDLSPEEIIAQLRLLESNDIIERDLRGYFKPSIGARSLSHYPELGVEYGKYFAKYQMRALEERRDNFCVSNSLAVSNETASKIYQKYAEFEIFAKVEAKKDQKRDLVLHMDHFFWLLLKDKVQINVGLNGIQEKSMDQDSIAK